MSNELLNQIFDKLVSMETEIKDVKSSVNRMEKKLDSTFDQVAKNSEAIEILINGQNKGEYQFQAFNKRLHAVETETERLKG